MITKMTKYSFILYHMEVQTFLERVQEIGMVDITRENKVVDEHSKEKFALLERYATAEKSIKALSETLSEKNISSAPDLNGFSPEELLVSTEKSLEERIYLNSELKSMSRERDEAAQWGAFTKEDIDKISSLGYKMHCFVISESNYDSEWENKYIIHILSKKDGKCYFVILTKEDEELNFKYPESKFPTTSYHIIESKIEEVRLNIEATEARLSSLLKMSEIMHSGAVLERASLDLHLAGVASVKEAEGTIAIMTGFAPADKREELHKFFENTGVYFIEDVAKEEDNPPIKLKNNFFTKLFEPIGELYMLPKYGELDLTPYFAPFYMLFFGLCLGDIGYGIVLLIAGTIGRFKLPKFKGYMMLIQFLGIGAMLMPMLNGVFFGAKIQDIIPMPDSIKELFFSDIKMFWFAIIFGLFQIVVARLVNAIDSMIRKGWQHGMHNLGWAILVIWLAIIYAGTMMPDLIIPAYVNYIGYAGLAFIILFSSVEGNIFKRIMKGAFSLYDITGIFGDMLSYIRLFGLGTAGGILGLVVNSVAMNMSGIPYVGWFFTGLMLLVGHTAVLLLNSLGAFVHPMRLTFVEFYKNAGFGGGGRAFRPLTKNEN
jgi:V/A-type H+-transporting ATPase subunit I